MKGHRVTRIDAEKQTAHLDDGRTIKYDKCLIATGTQKFFLGHHFRIHKAIPYTYGDRKMCQFHANLLDVYFFEILFSLA